MSVQADFDRIALLSEEEGWGHNSHYHGFLLRHLPPRCGEALDVGCGTGAFSRLLAARCDRVLGVDLSPQMVRVARERSGQHPNIEFQVADVMEVELPPDRFDCIASIATLHHLPMEPVLARLARSLRAGGTLLVLDLFQAEGPADMLMSALAVLVTFVLKLVHGVPLVQSREAREAWAEHGESDRYPTLSEARRVCAAVLPGARVRKHLIWRYSIVWKKPGSF
jgi:ubiquinone/menaquinone biosynthesis C-methylase UbiE